MSPVNCCIVLLVFGWSITMMHAEDPPDARLTTPQIIARYGYPSEAHTILTEDGYLLTLHRIPHNKTSSKATQKFRQPVLVHHGLVATSADFVISGEENSLGFILSNAGYDVWLGNARGNQYSQSHIKYNTNDAQFWDFSWDDMARYDLPATIDYIGNTTNQSGNILYVGHSMGTTIFFALMASRPEYNAKIKAMFGLAPVAFVRNVQSPIRYLAPWVNDVRWITKFVGINEFLPNLKLLRFLASFGCDKQTAIKYICTNFLFILAGFDEQQFNMNLLPVILHHTPASTSVRTVLQFGQEINDGQFQHYDFGATENSRKYGSNSPPKYNASAIQVPAALYYADNDWLASPRDVNYLYRQLPNPILMYRVPFDQFNHLDFLWAKDVRTLLYNPLLAHMKKYK